MEPAPVSGTTTIDCGQQFPPPSDGVLEVAGEFPAEVPAAQQTLSGTVEVLSHEELRGVAPPGADVFLVRDGRVVTTPLPQDAVGILWAVASGGTKSMPGQVALTSCESGEPLEPGVYEMYARVTVIPDDGEAVESFGGPWPLDVQ